MNNLKNRKQINDIIVNMQWENDFDFPSMIHTVIQSESKDVE